MKKKDKTGSFQSVLIMIGLHTLVPARLLRKKTNNAAYSLDVSKKIFFSFNYLGVGKVTNHFFKQMRKDIMLCDEVFTCHRPIEYSFCGLVLIKVQR